MGSKQFFGYISLLILLDQLIKAGLVTFYSQIIFINTTTVPMIRLAIMAVVVIYLLWWFYSSKDEREKPMEWGSVCIIAGGVSNGIDAVFHKGIIDWIQLGSLYANLADLYILIGSLLVIATLLQIKTR